MAESPTDNLGTPYMALGWALTGLVVLAVSLRIYSRIFITRSFGSDDVAILFSMCLSVSGEVLDTFAVVNGLGRHIQYVPIDHLASILKWEFILWIMVYISFFFVRTSVMLFTLRLLPATKLWLARIVCLALFLNFAITVFAVVSWGLICVPFDVSYRRLYEQIPVQHCEPEKVTVAAQKVNGIMACVIDITTALIPTSLVWNIRIKRKTKIILDAIFLLGLVTSALSIGRALSFPGDIWSNDTTWRLIKSSTFSLIEEKLGIIFASCPALRQLCVYISRTRTILPSRHREAPNEDFVKMRTKVKLREIFWAEGSKKSTSTAILGAPIHPPESELDEGTRRYAASHGKLSALDRFTTFFTSSRSNSHFWHLRSSSFGSTWMSGHVRSRPSKSSTVSEGLNSKTLITGATSAQQTRQSPEKMSEWEWPSRGQDGKGEASKQSLSQFTSYQNSQGGATGSDSATGRCTSLGQEGSTSRSGLHDTTARSATREQLIGEAKSPEQKEHSPSRRSTSGHGERHEAGVDRRFDCDVEGSPGGPERQDDAELSRSAP